MGGWVDVGAKLMAGDAGDPLDCQDAEGRHLIPLRNGLGRDTEMAAQCDRPACDFNCFEECCFAHESDYKHYFHFNASYSFIEGMKVMLTVASMGKQFGKAIRAARRAKKLTLVELAGQVGVSYPAVQQWEAGKTEPTTDNLLKLCRLLDLDPLTEAVGRMEQQGTKVASAPAGAPASEPLQPDVDLSKAEPVPANQRFSGPRDVPVLGTAVGGGDGDGDFRFNGQEIDKAPRPPGIANRKDVFCLYVENDSMYPRFEPGERLYLDPHRKARAGEYVVVELFPESEGEAGQGYIKRFEKQTPTKLVVSQFNPAKELEFELQMVKKIYRVIPVDELLGI